MLRRLGRSSSNVGRSRMAGPFGTSFVPSTSKNSRTPLTSTRMAESPCEPASLRIGGSIRLVRPLDCFARDIRPCGMRRTADVTQSHFWRTPSLNVLRFRCQVEYVVRPQCHPDFIKLRARRPCSPCWRCPHRRQRNPMTSTRKCEFSSSRISCGSSPARMRSCNTATGSSKIA